MLTQTKEKVGRNDLCPCGSGRKFKKCCLQSEPDPAEPAVTAAAHPPASELQRLAAAYGTGDHSQVEALARGLTTLYPGSGTAWKYLGVSLAMLGKDGSQALRRAAELLPDDAETHGNLSNVLRRLGRLDDAANSARRAIEINPDFAEAHSNLGDALRESGRLDEAASSYREALRNKPYLAEAHNGLGNVLTSLGRHEEAAASYRHAIGIRPGLAEAHSNLSNALWKLGRLEDAAASCHRALEINPNYAQAHNNLGNVLRELGKLDAAVESCRRALQLKPDYAEAHNNLGNALRGLGHFEEAADNYRQALQLKSHYAEAHYNLGCALRDLGQVEEAADSYRRALQLRSDYPEAHRHLGSLLLNSFGDIDGAMQSYRCALRINPDDVDSHSQLASALRALSRTDEAEAHCRRALEIEPEAVLATEVLASLRADAGEFVEAEALYRRIIATEPDSVGAWSGLVAVRKMTTEDASWSREALRILDTKALSVQQEAQLRYAIGKYFDDLGSYEDAFSHYQRANELTRRVRPSYDPAFWARANDRIIGSYDRQWLGNNRSQIQMSERPVFVVGMPRSGTTLAEQILASHPDVFGAGEMPYWHQVYSAHESSAQTSPVPLDALEAQGLDYLRLLQERSADALRVVDKLPVNFRYLGLIHAAFPRARIIHMQRNPIDTCLSIYFQNFAIAHTYANGLDDLAHYYSEYRRVMQHWRSTLPMGSLLEVPYEGLVQEPETWSRRMVEFIGLPWDARCLDYYRTARPVHTASAWQVRQKINQSSVARWRHYQKFIGRLLPLDDLS